MELLGHTSMLDALKRAWSRDQVHHAYLFEGPHGVGKRRVAEYFAALINCITDRSPEDPNPCGTCRSCRKIMPSDRPDRESKHPDIIVLEPDGRQIKIEQVRDLIRLIPFPPIEASFRFVIIDPADKLGDAAANALLKTLEEPPSRTRFILVSSKPQSLPVTVRSRCQRMTFGRLTHTEVLTGLRTYRTDLPTDLEQIAVMADGSLGAAFNLLDDPIMQRRSQLIERLLQLTESDIRASFDLAADLKEYKTSLHTLFDVLRRFLRDALLLSLSDSPRDLTNTDFAKELKGYATLMGTEGVLFRLKLLEETQAEIERRNLNLTLALERFFINMSQPSGEEAARI
jgi:DNA polymerase III subunit delta'